MKISLVGKTSIKNYSLVENLQIKVPGASFAEL